MSNIGNKPIDPSQREMMQEVARLLDAFFNGSFRPKLTGFLLLVFPLDSVDKDARCNYISNADRLDIVRLLREQANRLDTNTQ
jgi:hypothetical protein